MSAALLTVGKWLLKQLAINPEGLIKFLIFGLMGFIGFIVLLVVIPFELITSVPSVELNSNGLKYIQMYEGVTNEIQQSKGVHIDPNELIAIDTVIYKQDLSHVTKNHISSLASYFIQRYEVTVKQTTYKEVMKNHKKVKVPVITYKKEIRYRAIPYNQALNKIASAYHFSQNDLNLVQRYLNTLLVSESGNSNSGSVGTLPFNLKQFIPEAEKLDKQTGIPASVTLAQITLESESNGHLSGLASRGKNLFGIKGVGPAGSVNMLTQEVYDGITLEIVAPFRAYYTFNESMVDHARVLSEPRYAKLFKYATNYVDYAIDLQRAGYATDPFYAQKLIRIINTDGLHQYDIPNIAYKPLH